MSSLWLRFCRLLGRYAEFSNSLSKKNDHSSFYYLILKRQRRKQTVIEQSVKSETQPRKAKLVNLNPTQDQPHNYPLATPRTKGTSSPACRCTWSTWERRARHLVNGGGRDGFQPSPAVQAVVNGYNYDSPSIRPPFDRAIGPFDDADCGSEA